jgi:MFS family permease
MMLTNALTFHHLVNRDREFPMVRVWGTIGFVVPAWLIELYWLKGLTGTELNQARGIALMLSGSAEILLAFYCLTLPHTPPQREAARRFAPAEVFGLLHRRDFQVLVIVTFLIAMVHQFFFVWNGPYLTWFLRASGILEAREQRIASIGQISEIAVMAGLGLAIVRLGFKWVLAVGATAYLVRCLIFAAVPLLTDSYLAATTLVYLGQALHGFCFGCFLATGFIYVDRVAPPDARGSMQTLYGTFLFGSGAFVGGLFGGEVGRWFQTSAGAQMQYDWSGIWLASAGLAAVALVVFLLLFPRQPQPPVADFDKDSRSLSPPQDIRTADDQIRR